MALPNDGIAPDRFELRLRFVFGAIAGGILVPVLLLRVLQPSASAAAIGVIGAAAGALGGGLLARHFGDRFWRAFLRLWTWPR